MFDKYPIVKLQKKYFILNFSLNQKLEAKRTALWIYNFKTTESSKIYVKNLLNVIPYLNHWILSLKF